MRNADHIMLRILFLSCAVLLSVESICAQNLETLPHYRPQHTVSGIIRVWGHGSPKHNFMAVLMKYWEEGFRKYQPGIRIENHMYGTASAIGALYTGTGDLAILGEEIQAAPAAAFERVMHYPPFGIEIATGSLDVRYFDYAHVFFVHKDNPLSKLTVTQLDAIFGAEHRRGPRNIRTWGELGLDGEWKGAPISPYGWRIDDDFAIYLQDALLLGSHKWNCDLRELAHATNPDGSVYEHSQRILDALAKDRYGIGVSNLRYMNAMVKPLALAVSDGGSYYAATKENLIDRKYPFTRIIPAFVNRTPGKPIDPKVQEFLRYLLSYEGQQDIVREGGYLPLSEASLREQLKKLD
jgi:phosphate transport system substrate-binding protein